MSEGMDAQRARTVCGALAELVQEAWARGWQPADLHRYAVRNHGPVEVAVLGDVMAADVARHAAATVDPRWHQQLEEIGAEVWWPASTDHLTARAGRTRGGWDAVRRAADALGIHACVPWPQLEQLGPLPGQASTRGGEVVDLDQKLLTRVRMMLAKAESTPYEQEAEAFTAAAQKLMARHSIDRAMLDEAERARGRVGGPSAIRVGVERPYESARFALLAAVAQANRCRAVWHQHLGFGTVVGFAVDLRAVELLHASLLVQATAAMRAEGSRTNRYGESTTRSFRSSFLTGFAHRIGERLAQATAEQAREMAGELAAGTTEGGRTPASGAADLWDRLPPGGHGTGGTDRADGTELALVMSRREEAVEEAVTERFPRLRSARSRRSLDAEGWHSGRAAAERAQLGVRGRLAR